MTVKILGANARTYREHILFAEKHPAEMKQALEVMNRWQRAEVTLAQAIAEAIMAARDGGSTPPPPAKTSTVRRRTR